VQPIHELLARIRWDPQFAQSRFHRVRDGSLIWQRHPAGEQV
jgi:hypothetical protein